MPFLRFSRDKRGYEHTYLVQATNRRGKAVRPRILYWYRTPPGVKLGRSPFDEDVRRTLEASHPGITFDWATIVNTPFPPPDPAEIWRERRRIEKAARQARREEERDSASASESGEQDDEEPGFGADETAILDSVSVAAEGPEEDRDEPSSALLADAVENTVPVQESESSPPAIDATPQAVETAGAAPRKRRRRGGRRRRGRTPEGGQDAATGGSAAADDSGPDAAPQDNESDADD